MKAWIILNLTLCKLLNRAGKKTILVDDKIYFKLDFYQKKIGNTSYIFCGFYIYLWI